jgi:hypothetical protein
MPEFIPGLALNEAFYWQAIRPILDRHYHTYPMPRPGLAHAGAPTSASTVSKGVFTV